MPTLPEFLRRSLAPVARAYRRLDYGHQLVARMPAGEARHVFTEAPEPRPLRIEVRVPAAAADADRATQWCRRQTLAEVRAVGLDGDGREVYRVDARGATDERAPAPFFLAPPRLPEVYAGWLESAMWVAAAEAVDAVVLGERLQPALGLEPRSVDELTTALLRGRTLFAADAWEHEADAGRVRPTADRLVVKVIDRHGVRGLEAAGDPALHHRFRRGDYLSNRDFGPRAELPLRDAGWLRRRPLPADRPRLLVLAPFLARGGAEHTLFETLRALRHRFELLFVTLAPHRPEIGDRRDDFEALWPRLYCLGDLVHPAAMPGILGALLDAYDVDLVYNANGTTLFYDFAPELKRRRPGVRIVDHLYDHRVGYIDRYGPELLASVDACVAENRPIARVLTEERGWPAERVPVIWPCGRPASAFASGDDAVRLRRRLRAELDLADDDVVILTAARMHAQKRPLDLVRLAERVRDLRRVAFLLVGGGDLEGQVDDTIAAVLEGRVRRLPFRTDIPDLIVAADVGCLVSDYEGLPVFLIECLQAGRPFLGTDVGDLGHVLRTSGAGWVVERPGDLEALEAAVRQLVDDDERARRARRAAAAAAEFDIDRCAERYAAAFIGQPQPGS